VTDTAKIINQLRVLLLLTRTEQQIARVRLAQARTDAVCRELTQNAEHAAERARRLPSSCAPSAACPTW
jgi:hypothetical protein